MGWTIFACLAATGVLGAGVAYATKGGCRRIRAVGYVTMTIAAFMFVAILVAVVR